MLGKTNITTVKGGTVVSDVADYGWDHVNANTASAFRKGFYGNSTLVGITMDGKILYMNDGENWIEANLQMESDYKIMDGLWDGSKFVFVGSHDVIESERCSGLIVTTADFTSYTVLSDCTGVEYDAENIYSYGICDTYIKTAFCGKFYALALNGDATYTIICAATSGYGSDYYVYLASGGLDDLKYQCVIGKTGYNSAPISNKEGKNLMDIISVGIARRSNEFLFYAKYPNKTSGGGGIFYYVHIIGLSHNGNSYTELEYYPHSVNDISSTNNYDIKKYNVFECKDSLYYIDLKQSPNNLIKLLSSGSKSVMSTGIDYAFADAVYFNKGEVFINEHEMLIVRQQESIADKTLDDLVDITYDFSMVSVVKAFNKLYIFGTGGNVLVSNDEVKNEEALAVKTMSAAKALHDAMKYADEKYMILESRIAALETAGV